MTIHFRIAPYKSAFLLLSMIGCGQCLADSFDLTFPAGLTVKFVGTNTSSSPPPWDQGSANVAFNEPINTSWWSGCVTQRFYINLHNPGGRATYGTLVMAQALGKKVTQLTGITNDMYGMCSLISIQVDM
jgi:hypothetical protein